MISSVRLIHIMSAILVLMAAGGGIGMLAFGGRRLWFYGIFAIVMAAMTVWKFWNKRPDSVPIGYSYSHAARHRRLLWRCVGVILFCVGLACFPALVPLQHLPAIFLGTMIAAWVFLLAGGILFAAFGFPLRFERNAGPYFLIHGCGKSFLMSFPESGLGASPLGSFVAKRFT